MRNAVIALLTMLSLSTFAGELINPVINIDGNGEGLISCEQLSPNEICSLIDASYSYARDIKCKRASYSKNPFFHIKHKLEGAHAWLSSPCIAPARGGCTSDSEAPVYSRTLATPIYEIGFRSSNDLRRNMLLSEEVSTLQDKSYVANIVCE